MPLRAKRSNPDVAAFARSLVIVLITSTTADAKSVSFDRFLTNEARCVRNGDFGAFEAALSIRYRNNYGTKNTTIRQDIEVPIPRDVATGVGVARSTNMGSWTKIVVPLKGTWRGLALKELEFGFGNENGVQFWTFRFAESRNVVSRTFGQEVADTKRAFKNDADELVRQFRDVKITQSEPGSIMCDFST